MSFRDELFPRAFMPTLVISNGKVTELRAATMSPPDMAITLNNVIEYSAEVMQDFKTSYFKYLQNNAPQNDEISELTDSSWIFDPDSVTGLMIRFLYKPIE